jgi:hypothetical protein
VLPYLQRMKTRLVAIGLALVVVVGALTWFWLLASVPRTEARELTLGVLQSPVMVKAQGESAFRDAESGMVLHVGDTVKTGASGQAVIHFFGLAESRLDHDTELVVHEGSQAAVEADSLNVRMELSAGRVWSRVLRLFDLDSEFSVETPAIVATVRGTAFDVGFGADGVTRVWVSDSAVGVLPATSQDRAAMLRQLRGVRESFAASTGTAALATATELALGALPAGEMAHYDAQGTPLVHRRLSPEDRDTAWFKQNTEQDDAFVAEVTAHRRAELARLGGARPDQLRVGLTALSERAHLWFAGEERTEEQMEQYLVRRIARLLDLVDEGKTGLASQEFARLENELRAGVRGEDGEMVRKRARAAFVRAARLVESADPSSPQYPFKQRIEDLLVTFQEGDAAAELFMRLVAVEARIDEASRLLDAEELGTARIALDAARGGIGNVSRDAEPVLLTISPERQEALLGKILALIAREAAERARLEVIVETQNNSTSSEGAEGDSSATSTPPVVPPVVVPTSTSPVPVPPVIEVSTPEFTGIRLAVGIGTVTVGVPAAMGVIADRADGSNKDVSAQSTFRVVSGAGTVNTNGPQFTPTVAGLIVIEASYNDNGIIRTVETGVTATSAATLQSLRITPASASIKNGERVTLTATAVYADGGTKDVTGAVAWSFAPTANGSMSGNVFIGVNAARASPVGVVLEGSYTEAGVTRLGTSSITIN